MWKAFGVMLILAAAIVPTTALAAQDLCRIVCVNGCDGSNICVLATESGTRVCAGLGFGLQGVAVCVDPIAGCVWTYAGIDRDMVCNPIQVVLP